MFIRVIDLDGGVAGRQEFLDGHAAQVVSMQDWGPSIRLCCSFSAFRRFERACAERCAPETRAPAISFCGSGDFHHVTLALLRRLRVPFNLLIVDKHPDWSRGAPVVHCGTWLAHALRLPSLRRVFHLGADLDLDNWLYWCAPRRPLREGKIRVAPAVRRLTRGAWRSVDCEPLRPEPDRPMSTERLESLCGGFKDDLARVPLYISIDKDVMRPSDAPVNWDSGRLELAEVQRILTSLIGAAGGRMLGIDVVGDWSPPRTRGMLRSLLNVTERAKLRVDPEHAASVNSRTNRALIETVQRAMSRSIPPAGAGASAAGQEVVP